MSREKGMKEERKKKKGRGWEKGEKALRQCVQGGGAYPARLTNICIYFRSGGASLLLADGHFPITPSLLIGPAPTEVIGRGGHVNCVHK